MILEISVGFNDLPKVVQHHRKAAGQTQAGLAQLAGVGKTVIFDIENGKRSVRADTLLKVLAVLNIQCRLVSPLMHAFVRTQDEKG